MCTTVPTTPAVLPGSLWPRSRGWRRCRVPGFGHSASTGRISGWQPADLSPAQSFAGPSRASPARPELSAKITLNCLVSCCVPPPLAVDNENILRTYTLSVSCSASHVQLPIFSVSCFDLHRSPTLPTAFRTRHSGFVQSFCPLWVDADANRSGIKRIRKVTA
jgi:hypothetical protein